MSTALAYRTGRTALQFGHSLAALLCEAARLAQLYGAEVGAAYRAGAQL